MDTIPHPDLAEADTGRLAYGIAEAAAITGTSRTGLYRAMAAGHLAFRQLGGRRLILAADLRRWLDELPLGASDGSP